MKLRPRIHSTTAVGRRLAAHAPTDEARAWLIVVAIRMPSMTAQGRRYREAIDNATNCVLSPISASATTMNELRSAIIALSVRCSEGCRSCGGQWDVIRRRDDAATESDPPRISIEVDHDLILEDLYIWD